MIEFLQTVMPFALMASISLNLWQLWRSICHEQREKYIQVLEKELNDLQRSLKVTRARLR